MARLVKRVLEQERDALVEAGREHQECGARPARGAPGPLQGPGHHCRHSGQYTPVLCRVRQRATEHGAEDVDAPARWRKWFAEDQAGRHERDLALPAEPATRGRNKLFKG